MPPEFWMNFVGPAIMLIAVAIAGWINNRKIDKSAKKLEDKVDANTQVTEAAASHAAVAATNAEVAANKAEASQATVSEAHDAGYCAGIAASVAKAHERINQLERGHKELVDGHTEILGKHEKTQAMLKEVLAVVRKK